MIWGIEGRWVYLPPSYAGTPAAAAALTNAAVLAAGGVVLNYRVDDSGARVLPVHWVEHITGLHGTGESGDNRDNAVGRPGELPRRSFRRGKTITLEGQTRARTHAALRTAQEQLSSAFDEQNGEGLVVVKPHPTYGSGYRHFKARSMTCEIDDAVLWTPNRGHEGSFVIALRNARAGGVSYRDQAGATYK